MRRDTELRRMHVHSLILINRFLINYCNNRLTVQDSSVQCALPTHEKRDRSVYRLHRLKVSRNESFAIDCEIVANRRAVLAAAAKLKHIGRSVPVAVGT